jgi:tetratricopeptide (TPR) repeat protein
LGRVYAETGRTAEAAAAFGEAADRSDERAAATTGAGKKPEVTARYNQGVMLAKIGKLQDALAAYEKVLAVDPRYYDALVNSGFVLFRQKQTEEALTRFKTATTVRPTVPLAWINLATLHTQKNDHANAAAAWRKVTALEATNYDARAFLATELTRLNQPIEAIKVYEQMGALRPKAAEPLIAIGLLFQKQADAVKTAAQKQANLVQAKQAFEEAIRREPKSAIAYNNLGVVHERRGEMPEAIAAYKKALSLDPVFGDAKKNLARFKIGMPTAGAAAAATGTTSARTPAPPKKP